MDSSGNDLNELCLLVAERQAVPAKTKLDPVAQRTPADEFDARASAEAHLEQPPADVNVAPHRHHAAAAADAQGVQRTGFRRPAMIAAREIARFLHVFTSPRSSTNRSIPR